jgi:ADP-ribose pyrophosphatase YjhB (NUDIX family)
LKRDYPDRPIVGVGAVIIRDQRAVIVRRGGEPLAGEWSIPGGVLELGETLRQGAEREVLEETGLTVRAGEVIEVFDSIVPDAAGRTQYHYVLIDFLCECISGELRAGGDAADARWIKLDELAQLSLRGSVEAVLRKGFEAADKQPGAFNAQRRREE